MNLRRFIRAKGEVIDCPFCQFPLSYIDHQYFKTQGQIGYRCLRCIVPGARTANDKPFSRYHVAVIEDFTTGTITFGQLIISESFVIHVEDNKWYNISNSLIKEQTAIAMVVPASKEHFFDGEKVAGLAYVSAQLYFPLIDSWEPWNKEATLEKIKTYILFS
jgi:hypothetical protein